MMDRAGSAQSNRHSKNMALVMQGAANMGCFQKHLQTQSSPAFKSAPGQALLIVNLQ